MKIEKENLNKKVGVGATMKVISQKAGNDFGNGEWKKKRRKLIGD